MKILFNYSHKHKRKHKIVPMRNNHHTANLDYPLLHGFTLIELLVVVAIIAVLVAILLPALSQARNQAQCVSCRSNLRQIAIGFSYYTNDFNMLPSRNNMSAFYINYTKELIAPEYWEYWYERKADPSYDYLKDKWRRNYISNFSVMRCPADKGDTMNLWPEFGDNLFKNTGTSYFYNCRDNFEDDNDLHLGSLIRRNFSSIENPSIVIVLGDPEMCAYAGNNTTRQSRWRWHDPEENYANVIFTDFHVAGIVMTYDDPDYQTGRGWTFIAIPDINEPDN